ncbi:MAG: dipeptide ABC transporter ATP-binding protein [Paracoccaceae bacterium]
MTDNPIILRVENLTVEFDLRHGILRAVNDASITLRRGKTLCIVGESGSGKSVMARTILNLADPAVVKNGHVWFDDPDNGVSTDITALEPKGDEIREIRGKRIAMIFQEPSSALSPVHTIGFQIMESVRHARPDMDENAVRERAIDLLRRVAIPNPEQEVDRYPFQYSGGMRQRAMIAMALAGEPDILIADEPTTALDVTTQAEILRLLRDLQNEFHMAVLFITHDIGVVAEFADDVAVMYRGTIREIATVADIFRNPKDAYSKKLIGAAIALETAENKSAAIPEDAEAILKVDNLCVTFNIRKSLFARHSIELKACDDISFTLRKGESFGIVGESGSGKTTLGKTLLGLNPVASGSIEYSGGDNGILDLSKPELMRENGVYRDIRMIFQDPFSSLNPRMTVEQIIAEPMLINKTVATGPEMRKRVASLLERVQMPSDVMTRYPHAFSGGQRQRICIARAIALDPKIVIADEATSALDGSIRAQVLDLLLELRDELGLSFIFIGHDLSVVRYFCDRIAVMQRGRIVEIGEADQIIDAPTHEYTKSLVAAVPRPNPFERKLFTSVT